MELPIHTASFKNGMNKDISPNEYPNTYYYDALNLRLITDNSEGSSTLALSTPKGNSLRFSLPPYMYMYGHTTIRDSLIILARNTTGYGNDPKPDKIYKIPFSDITSLTETTVFSQWTNSVFPNGIGFATLTTDGLDITNATSGNSTQGCYTDTYLGTLNEVITVNYNYHLIYPEPAKAVAALYMVDGLGQTIYPALQYLLEGPNTVRFTLPADDVYTLKLLVSITPVGLTQTPEFSLTDVVVTVAKAVTNQYYWTGSNRYLVYQGDLGFDPIYPTTHPIRVVGNYENDDIQKIYWIDGLNPLKHLNLIYDATYNKLDTLSEELLTILPNNTYGIYTLLEQLGGKLKAGRIQYSYQLYTISGAETMFAPASNLYNLTSSITSGLDFTGSDIEDLVNKSIKVTITLATDTSYTFNRIRLVALEYERYNDTPTVRVVAEQKLTSDVAVFIDSGNKIGELLLEEFQAIKNDLIPNTIETKNGYLFAGNITEEFFDLDETVSTLVGATKSYFDSRAYRWRYLKTMERTYSQQEYNTYTDPAGVSDLAGRGIPSFEIDSTSLTMNENNWLVKIKVGGRGDITTAGNTFSALQSIDCTSFTIQFFTTGWNESVEFTIDPDRSFTLSPIDASRDWIILSGTSYTSYSTEPWNFPAYTNKACVSFIYTMSYSALVGISAINCVLNQGLSNQLILNDLYHATDFNNVPEEHDCINTYNNISNDIVVDHEYKYKSTVHDPPVLSDLGGSGPFISYEFITTDVVAGLKGIAGNAGSIVSYLYSNQSAPGYQSPQTILDYTSHQRDEVYRYAFVAYDLKGRASYAKWIADIRFPKTNEELGTGLSWDGVELTKIQTSDPDNILGINILGIKFTLDFTAIEAAYPGLLSLLSGYQIVRCNREEDDITIKAGGLVLPTHYPKTPAGQIKDAYYSSYNITSAKDYEDNVVTQITDVTGTNSNLGKTLVELISPEIAINKDLIIDPNNDFIEIYGNLTNVTSSTGWDGVDEKTYNVTATNITSYPTTLSDRSGNWRKDVTNAIISTPEAKDSVIHTISTLPFVARGYDDNLTGANPFMTYKGTTLVCKIDGAFVNITNTLVGNGGEEAMVGRYRRSLGYSIYGGNTYHERSSSTYYPASGFVPIGTSSIEVYNGDTYIGYFNFIKLAFDNNPEYSPNSGQVVVSFPIESRINLSYQSDKLLSYINSGYLYYLSERQSIGVSQYPNNYPEVGNLYRYNSAYSAPNTSKVFLPKPFDYRSTQTNDTMIVSSEKKLNGEFSDSWLKFKYNNYIELEGKYGSVTRLINFNDKLLAFQDQGIAVLSVLDREVVTSNNTNTLVVGTGGILSRYDYLSKKVGTDLYDSICSTELGLYFYDRRNHSIYRILENIESISDVKGMKSYMESTPYTACITGYDKDNREVLFTFNSDYMTLVFSGFTDSFQGFFSLGYTGVPVINYINFDKYLFSTVDNNQFYMHNIGKYNTFYDYSKPSILTLIVNPNKTNISTFHIVEWLTDLTDSNGDDLLTETFDTLRITNTAQDTGVISLVNTGLYPNLDVIRRFRKWRLNLFRDQVDDGRIRDSWIKAKFQWTQLKPSINKKLIIHPINFSWTSTKLR